MHTYITTGLKLAAVNVAVLAALAVPVELAFGTWLRELRLSDLRRFSIPIDTNYTFDPGTLYGAPGAAVYTRDQYGLRGRYPSLDAVDVVTIGGSTTDQRYLDDSRTWQAVAETALAEAGHPLVFANAGVDGQTTTGHLFVVDHWMPLLPGFRPRWYLFYVGANDVLRRDDRGAYDASVDPSSWRFRSAIFQLVRTVRGNLRARAVGVAHGRMPEGTAGEFTTEGLVAETPLNELATRASADFLVNVDALAARVSARGGRPVFVTQTAYAWNADRQPPRGVRRTLTVHGERMNYADVARLHQHLNRSLLAHCAAKGYVCFDLANDVSFEAVDYYDYLHNTPSGAEKIGRYLAARLAALPGEGHQP